MLIKISKDIIKLIAAIIAMTATLSAFPQSNKGTITPVESDDNAPQQPVLHYYDKHGNKLDTPVLYLAELDTASRIRPQSPYPLFNGVTVGINFVDVVMAIAGQKHSSYDISAIVSLHNWFFPVVEAGIGWGSHTETNDLFKVKAYPSMFAKVGINYNFLYKSNPDYMAYFGLRFGVAQCHWDKTDILSSNDEGETVMLPNEMNQKCVSTFGEVVGGLKVQIAGPFSLGWSVRYRLGLHNSKGRSPWFIPGYGTGPLGFTFNAYITFGEKKRRDQLTDLLSIPETAPNPDDTLNVAPDNTPDNTPGDSQDNTPEQNSISEPDNNENHIQQAL